MFNLEMTPNVHFYRTRMPRFSKSFVLPTFLALAVAVGSCNPFAPGLDDIKVDRISLLGDRRTVTGFFQWFRNSYETRDTSLYGQILSKDFVFISKDFGNGNNNQWDRDTEMRITTNMFRQIQLAQLVWSWYKTADTLGADTIASVERYFNLTVQVDETNIIQGTGTARLTLVRPDTASPWKVRTWVDIRDF
jgi:hypothetical protein